MRYDGIIGIIPAFIATWQVLDRHKKKNVRNSKAAVAEPKVWGEVAFHLRLTFHLCNFFAINSPSYPHTSTQFPPPIPFTLIAKNSIYTDPHLKNPPKDKIFFHFSIPPPPRPTPLSLSLSLSHTHTHTVSSSFTWVFAKGMIFRQAG
ncbi:hypothetical protein Pfo_020746, partial [Paulownia fortunei]